MKPTDIRATYAELYFLEIKTRVPLKFGAETLDSVTCARVRLRVRRSDGHEAEGWGETPLSVQWVWPGALAYTERHEALRAFSHALAKAWSGFDECGHALEVGHAFLERELPAHWRQFNKGRAASEQMPWLAALVCCAAFDLALHDAYGIANNAPTYETYGPRWLSRDLSQFLQPAADRLPEISFASRWPCDYLLPQRKDELLAWHLVGGLDPITAADLTGAEPEDPYPVLLEDWIKRDGLRALKVKLRGNDGAWDYHRLLQVGDIALRSDVLWLTADFNCTVVDPEYVVEILDRLRDDAPRIFALLLYVEQPFPYELAAHPIAVHAVSARKPLFLDESAHDWREIRRGRELGWSGVALKTCKTQTGALLSLCWARAHGMTLMVQDLTNPMLAQVSHCLLAAHAPTIAGVETNAVQFYPEASLAEAAIHPGLYRRINGRVALSTVHGPGFGYRVGEIHRRLPAMESI